MRILAVGVEEVEKGYERLTHLKPSSLAFAHDAADAIEYLKRMFLAGVYFDLVICENQGEVEPIFEYTGTLGLPIGVVSFSELPVEIK